MGRTSRRLLISAVSLLVVAVIGGFVAHAWYSDEVCNSGATLKCRLGTIGLIASGPGGMVGLLLLAAGLLTTAAELMDRRRARRR